MNFKSSMVESRFGGALKPRMIVALALGGLGFAINSFGLPLGYGAHLLVGNAVALLALRICGRYAGMLAFTIASAQTIFLWGHPWAWAVWSAEGACLALLSRRFVLPVVDFGFWLVAGAPALFLSYGLLLGMRGHSLELVVCKQVFNGLLNVVFAEALYLAMVAVPRVRSRLRLDTISLKAAVVSSLLLLVLVPSVIYVLIAANSNKNLVTDQINANLSGESDVIKNELGGWTTRLELLLLLCGQEWLNNETKTGGRRHISEALMARLSEEFDEVLIVSAARRTLSTLIDKEGRHGTSSSGEHESDKPWANDRLTILDKHKEEGRPAHFDVIVPVSAHGEFIYVYGSPTPSSILRFDAISHVGGMSKIKIFDTQGALVLAVNDHGPDAADVLLNRGVASLEKDTLYIVADSGFGTSLMVHQANAMGVLISALPALDGWTLAVATPTKPYVAEVRVRQLQVFEAMIAILAVVMAGSYWSAALLESALRAVGKSVIPSERTPSSRLMTHFLFLSELATISKGVDKFRESLFKERHDAKTYADRLQTIASYAPLIVYSMDRSGTANEKTEYFGSAIKRLYGYDDSEVTGAGWWFDRVHPDDREKVAAEFLGQDKVGAISGEYRFRTKTGAYRWVFDTQALTEAGTGMGILLDINEQKETQRLLFQAAKLTSLGEMATGMAHELNQPLNVIKLAASNLVELSRRGTLPEEELKKRLKRILDQTERAASLISHLRVFGRMPDEKEQLFDVSAAINGALSLVGAQMRSQNVSLERNFENTLPRILGHAILFEQVILNLVMNARDAIFSKKNAAGSSGHITISAYHRDACVHITITDNGGGIPAVHLSRIFEPFFTTKELGKGTGLGLSISYGIVRDMGGQIVAENVPDGARFTISIPIRNASSGRIS